MRDKLALAMLKPINPSIIIVLGLYTVLWGLWLINPFASTFAISPLYGVIGGIASEYVWGGIAVASGLAICRGAMKPSYTNLRHGAFIGFLLWLIIGILYLLGSLSSTGGLGALTFAVYSGIVWLNLKANRDFFDQ